MRIRVHNIAFFSKTIITRIKCKVDVSCCRSTSCFNSHLLTEFRFIICRQSICRSFEITCIRINKDLAADCHITFCFSAVPLSQLRNNRRFCISTIFFMFSRNCDCMFYSSFCIILLLCSLCCNRFCRLRHLINTFNLCICKRLIDLSVSSDDLLIISKELYFYSLRSIPC